MFSNNQIDLESLPKVEDINFKPIEKRYFKIIVINLLLTFLALISVLTVVRFFLKKKEIFYNSIYWYALIVLIVIFFVLLIIDSIGFKKRKFAIRDKDITYSKGLLVNTTTTLPFNRIQHTEVVRSLFARKLGLSTLKIYSAGESGGDLVINGLAKEEAESINVFLTNILNDRV